MQVCPVAPAQEHVTGPFPKRITSGLPPSPLRDACNLEGRPDLTKHEQDRVTLANAVYATAEAVLYACYEVGVKTRRS